ncbi:MAG: hypothetical protein KAJ43_01985, partial [Gemmatimonadetes bacterium]|nr:hypothetical protein [Gemmatimonadota bacterium]
TRERPVNAKRARLLRWLVLVLLTAVGGWIVYLLGGVLVALAAGGSAGLIRMLVGAYAALAAGFLFCALLTRLAPGRRYTVAVGLVFVTVVVAAALMLDDKSEAGPIPAVLLGISLVVGAFGYALRVRGFSETVSGREI